MAPDLDCCQHTGHVSRTPSARRGTSDEIGDLVPTAVRRGMSRRYAQLTVSADPPTQDSLELAYQAGCQCISQTDPQSPSPSLASWRRHRLLQPRTSPRRAACPLWPCAFTKPQRCGQSICSAIYLMGLLPLSCRPRVQPRQAPDRGCGPPRPRRTDWLSSKEFSPSVSIELRDTSLEANDRTMAASLAPWPTCRDIVPGLSALAATRVHSAFNHLILTRCKFRPSRAFSLDGDRLRSFLSVFHVAFAAYLPLLSHGCIQQSPSWASHRHGQGHSTRDPRAKRAKL